MTITATNDTISQIQKGHIAGKDSLPITVSDYTIVTAANN